MPTLASNSLGLIFSLKDHNAILFNYGRPKKLFYTYYILWSIPHSKYSIGIFQRRRSLEEKQEVSSSRFDTSPQYFLVQKHTNSSRRMNFYHEHPPWIMHPFPPSVWLEHLSQEMQCTKFQIVHLVFKRTSDVAYMPPGLCWVTAPVRLPLVFPPSFPKPPHSAALVFVGSANPIRVTVFIHITDHFLPGKAVA